MNNTTSDVSIPTCTDSISSDNLLKSFISFKSFEKTPIFKRDLVQILIDNNSGKTSVTFFKNENLKVMSKSSDLITDFNNKTQVITEQMKRIAIQHCRMDVHHPIIVEVTAVNPMQQVKFGIYPW